MTDKFSPGHLGDFVTFCDICGQKTWFSECVPSQDVYTGKGGTLACLECADPIHYGLVPYTIRAERPVPMSRDTVYAANPSAVPQTNAVFDASVFDPMAITVNQWNAFFAPCKYIQARPIELTMPYRVGYNPADTGITGLDWSAITTDWSKITDDWASANVIPGGYQLDENGDVGFPEFPSDD